MPKIDKRPSVQFYDSPEAFRQRMEPLLLRNEPRYGLMLGILLGVIQQPNLYGKNPPTFWIAEDGNESDNGIAAAALRTPPYGIVTFSERADCRPGLRAIAEDIAIRDPALPTVDGPEPVCAEFAALWTEITGIPHRVAVRERAFELRQVIPPPYNPGQLRQAILDDLDLMAQWFVDFTVEALHGVHETTLSESRERVQNRLERGMIYVWEDGEIVSLTGTTRPTPNGISIGPVYTPPQFRGKGYASSCVAQVSQRLLNQGRSFCTLFTDLTNPTSNKIYQSIGYRPICDYTVYSFKD